MQFRKLGLLAIAAALCVPTFAQENKEKKEWDRKLTQ